VSELKDLVRRELERLQPSEDGLEKVIVRVDRRRRRRRAAAGGLGVVLTVALVVGVLVVPRPAHRSSAGAALGRIAFSRDGSEGGIYTMNRDGTELTRVTTDPGDDQAAWSPNGAEIAFVHYHGGNADIYVVRADGTGTRRLTADGASGSPAWSSNGTRIAFARETPGNADIYVMNADGTHVANLTHDPLLEYTPAWSSDGSKIAFAGYSAGPPPSATHLYVMNADGSGMTEIGPENAALPSWSPTGTEIGFVNEDSGAIYVGGPDGTGLRRVVDVSTLPGGSDFRANFTSRPAWSPDGTKIVFAAGSTASSHLYVVHVDGSGLLQLTNGSVSDRDPAWLASAPAPRTPFRGGKIAYFASTGDGGNAIFTVAPNGTGRMQVTHIPYLSACCRPSWSSDGKRILFSRGISEGNGELAVINADGSRLRVIPGDPLLVYNEPAWSPDGTRIAFSSGDGQLDIVQSDGTHLRQVFSKPASCSVVDPSWSPDGTRLVFDFSCNSNSGPGTTSIEVIGADGTGRTTLAGPARARGGSLGPSWSPDGAHILFAQSQPRSNGGGKPQIYVMNADGSGVRRLTTGFANYAPTWSPDGSSVAFISTRSGVPQIYVMSADGTAQTRVSPEALGVTSLAWGR
jgi:TolB protein